MKADTWMPLYVAAYRKKTARLTCEQHGAYLLLIMDCWVDGPLPDDDVALAQVARLELREWKKMRPVIQRFFAVVDGRWLNERVEEEREKAQRLSAARRESGRQGGRPRKQTESDQKPIGFTEQNQNGSQTETPAFVARPSPTEVRGSKKPLTISERERADERAGGSSASRAEPFDVEAYQAASIAKLKSKQEGQDDVVSAA